LIICREKHKHSPETVAAHLGISADEYKEIETGKTLLTWQQARRLGKLFNVKVRYIYHAALQLDLLLSKTEMVSFQKGRIGELKQQLQQLQSMSGNKTTEADTVKS
jgi:DNA-binding XRE family transcriptional regulator